MMNERTPFSSTIKSDARKFARNRKQNSAIDETRASESSEFSQKSQERFGGNERGSEDVMDMYEKGAFDND